jgi:hypothetical protein
MRSLFDSFPISLQQSRSFNIQSLIVIENNLWTCGVMHV